MRVKWERRKMTQTAKAKHFKYVESAMHVQVKYMKDVTGIPVFFIV